MINLVNLYKNTIRLLIFTTLVVIFTFGGFGGTEISAKAENLCQNVTNITGDYQCSGECFIRGDVIEVSGETDTVKSLENMKKPFYQVDIKGSDNFSEVEIGPLVGLTLRTATSNVSDYIFPVLEDYIFDTDDNCQATGFTKIVRNPTAENFKSCLISCQHS